MQMGIVLLLAALLGACDSSDGSAVRADAPIDTSMAVTDAPYSCMPVDPIALPAACLALEASTLRGMTPFGAVDVALDYFGSGDCITISAAQLSWTGACGEQLHLQFPYPVVATGSGRRVTGSFDSDARFEYRPPGMPPREDATTVHVDVAQWQEGQGVHDIDILITITDADYALAPIHVAGTFCDWPYYVC